MNLKDYITIDEEVQPEQVKNNIPLLEVKVKFHIKGQPMPTPIDIVNINYKLQSHYSPNNPFKENKWCFNHKEIEDYIINYYDIYTDRVKCTYFYVTKVENVNE